MDDKNRQQISELSVLTESLKNGKINITERMAELIGDLIKAIKQEVESPKTDSVKLCPYCSNVPKQSFVYDLETSQRKYLLSCSICRESSGDYFDTVGEAFEDWNKWVDIKKGIAQ